MNRVLRVEVDDPIFGLNGSFHRVGWCNLYWSQDKAILLVLVSNIGFVGDQYSIVNVSHSAAHWAILLPLSFRG